MKLKYSTCKHFAHKWNYFKVDSISVRCCRRCNRLQHRMTFAGKTFWTFSVQYTEKGAKENVEGYNEI